MGMDKKWPIGVFDSGVGGLTVLKQLRSELPNEDYIYLGDTINNPYGTRTDQNIIDLSSDIVKSLEAMPVKMAVIACNTITVVAQPTLQEVVKMPLIGNSRGLKTAKQQTKTNCIGVMATEATIRTHRHKEEAKTLSDKLIICEEACPTLANAIESGLVWKSEYEPVLRQHLDNMVKRNVDTVILGCTHYPIIKGLLENLANKYYEDRSIKFVDPGKETTSDVASKLKELALLNDNQVKGKLKVLFTEKLSGTEETVKKVLEEEVSINKIELKG